MPPSFLFTVKPVLISTPEDVTVSSGSTATFFCQVSGDPLPKVTWTKEDSREMVANSGRHVLTQNGMTLTLENVTPADEGLYRCVAQNEAGRVESSATLSVHCECGEHEIESEECRGMSLSLSLQRIRHSWSSLGINVLA